MKNAWSKADEFLELLLQRPPPGSFFKDHLFISVVFSKGINGNQVRAFLQSQLDKPFAVLQRDGVHAWSTVQRLGRSSDHDDHGVPRPVTGQQVVDGVLVHRADTSRHEVVSEDGEAEVSGQRRQRGFDAGELFGESGGFSGEITESPETQDAVWMITEDVVPTRRQVVRFYQSDGEIVSEVGPHCPTPHPRGSSTALFGCVPVDDEPGGVNGSDHPAVSEEDVKQQNSADGSQGQEAEDPLQHRDDLQVLLHLRAARPQGGGDVLQGREEAGAPAFQGARVGSEDRLHG